MGDLDLRLSKTAARSANARHVRLGRLLLENGKIAETDLNHALRLQKRIDAPLGDIMVAEGLVSKKDVRQALAYQAGTGGIEPVCDQPGPDLAKHLTAEECLSFGVVPWSQKADRLYVAATSPHGFSALCKIRSDQAGSYFPLIVDETNIRSRQSALYGEELARNASKRTPEAESCRSLQFTKTRRSVTATVLVALVLSLSFWSYSWVITAGVLLASLTLVMTTTLKASAFLSGMRIEALHAPPPATFRMPRVSVLVPLLRETEIAGQLIERLSKLTYPKSLLNVVLVLEQEDRLTRETISRTALPDWISVVEVPKEGSLTTKPRALNYALNFCKGSILGVWDAEDWPEVDQIEQVVTRFSTAPQEVVCLQGQLDYYNSRSNWLTRCFTIEYAIWWRIVMPGIARLGLVVPLGGTTLFFKRHALEQLGGWDAHNVTEDADLGVRLARHGYRTELIPTVTREEATSRVGGWVRQRSRWLKGFLVTYLVHMRRPTELLQQVGFWRFMGIQTLFLASVVQFATAPLLWSFWITLFGARHPVEDTLGDVAAWGLIGLFIFAELLNLAMGFVAVGTKDRRRLLAFVPTMMLYFILGTIAAYKALWELLRDPFFWDKTQHGVSSITDVSPDIEASEAYPSA